MKLFFSAMLSVLTIFQAYSGRQRATGIDKVDKFKIGLGWGIPVMDNSEDAVQFNVSGNWQLAKGIFKTKNFGRNGGIDYGFVYSFLYYKGYLSSPFWEQRIAEMDTDKNHTPPCLKKHKLVANVNFHYQFLKKMDTYVGIFGGVGIIKPTTPNKSYEYDIVDDHSYTERSWGLRGGATWYFNYCFGAGLEWDDDFESCYGFNGSGNTFYLKFNYLFSEKVQRERIIKKKQKNQEKLRKDQEDLEKWILEE